MTSQQKWQFWIDRGGTFTDIVARHPDGTLSSHKYLSSHTERYRDAAVFAVRDIMAVPEGAPFPAKAVEAIKMGTTVATNALLERAGERTLLVVTKGFRDALLIGQQHRDDLFTLKPSRPEPLYSDVIEINERVRADGTLDTPLDLAAAEKQLKTAFDQGHRCCAIVLMHGYHYPAHEQALAKIADALGFSQVSVSHDVSPLMKFIARGDTTVADAYLSPVLRRYVDEVRSAVGHTPLYFMQSNGGLAEASAFAGKDAVLSGPAGGIVGAAEAATRANAAQIIGFDMGGTSTDVSRYAGHYERVLDTVVAGVRLTVPMMDIHTVAAGGGSICSFSQGRYLVGPASAGADPGPACYGRGGPLTVTDCNLLLGKLQPHLFPSVFGPNGDQPLDAKAASRSIATIAQAIQAETGICPAPETIAEGFIAVAVEHMARAIKRVSVERGHNIKNHALLSFGGAGGQHACFVAEALGIERVIVPPFSGVLSALGIGLAKQSVIKDKACEYGAGETAALAKTVADLTADAQKQLALQGIPLNAQSIKIIAHMKYLGSDTTLAVPYGEFASMEKDFALQHQQHFGFTDPEAKVLVQSTAVETTGGGPGNTFTLRAAGTTKKARETQMMFSAGQQVAAPVYDKHTLTPEHPIDGPAIILENGGTIVVEPGWQACLLPDDTLDLRRQENRARQYHLANKPDPVLLEVFNNLFMSVAEEMGGVLAKTARSVNVKERLDFSCAVFDLKGQLIANAPHMPVHLGSMGECVTAVLATRRETMRPGDVYMTNDPYAGGTHLPDITVISPVFMASEDRPSFYVASRAHHADIGGISPGSMPPHSKTIDEEGIRFADFHLVREGSFNEKPLRRALASGPYPARNPDQNIADLKAQVAANMRGSKQVVQLVTSFGADVVRAYMGHVQDNAEEAVRQLIDRLEDGAFSYPMDCGGKIVVKVTVNRKNRSITVDFTGTSAALENNFNAPLAVTKAAVLYVFRTLTQCDIPLNAGCMKPIRLIVPAGSMLNPAAPAAVVAGNVETSQAVTNALFLATDSLAASQGTMNNLTFGNKHTQYYETIAGGTGAGPGFDGTDVIQSHMTNSRLTDPEVLEWRYPVLLEDFSVRRGSGGNGLYRGGNGAVRTIRFLEPMHAAILSSHRTSGPPGLNGGQSGHVGQTYVLHTDGIVQKLAASDHTAVGSGDTITIETPGGGGFGAIDNKVNKVASGV